MADCLIGLISGTSMDGVDAVLADFSVQPPRLLAALTRPFSSTQTEALDRLRARPDDFPTAALAQLDAELGEVFADAAVAVIEAAGLNPSAVLAIGSHGQTVLHRPDARPPFSLQIGDPARIAEITGLVTVADFRRADLAAGGQGAPLAPLLHRALLANPRENRVVANLGGIANITVLPAEGAISGFDTGPANCFLDLWYRRHQAGRFDQGGGWSAEGVVDETWLARLLDDPYFSRQPPKSTGIEAFSAAWLEARLPPWAGQRPADVQATLAEFSAASLVSAINQALPSGCQRLLLCGGGAHNRDLVSRIQRRLPGLPCEATDRHGVPGDFVEAMLFAWLAARRLALQALNTAPITGARGPVMLGAVYRPRPF